MSGLPNYSVTSVSHRLDTRNYGYRGLGARGACVHTTAGLNSLGWLLSGSAKAGRPASADYLIERNGHIYRLTEPEWYAYHAGQARLKFEGVTYTDVQVSELLLGIELECLDNELVTWQQVDALAQVIVQMSVDSDWRWPYYVLGHYEVARPLGRRSDPQGLDWGALMGRLYVRALAANVGGL